MPIKPKFVSNLTSKQFQKCLTHLQFNFEYAIHQERVTYLLHITIHSKQTNVIF